jgi:carbohydrate kinase (thermoresistant glucokinase family)
MSDRCGAIVVMGVSGVGKTTVAEVLAQRLDWTFCDGDLFHPLSNVEKMRSGTPLTDEDRWPWLQAVAVEIDRHRRAQKGFVVACSALKRAYRKILMEDRPDVRLVYLQGDHDLIMSRLAPRQGHYFPAKLLDSQFAALEEPDASENAITILVDKDIGAVVDEIVRELRVGSSS